MSSSPRPAIVVLDHDPTSAARLAAELTTRYGDDYEITVERDDASARRCIEGTVAAGVPLALVLVDRQADPSIVTTVHALAPQAKRALLLQWGEQRAAREEMVRRVALGQADYFVVRPTASPDERFHRTITEFLDEWWRLRGTAFEAVRIVGDERSPRSHEIRDLLARHDFPYGFYDRDSAAGRALLAEAGLAGDGPVVLLPDGRAFEDPTNLEVAEAVGARTRPGPGIYDVVVVGAGPAGLATSVTAASEGLRTALVEPVAIGGQAGTSSLIRNYLGFPRGISGAELASRAADQAILFGAEFVYGSSAISLTPGDGLLSVGLSTGGAIETRTVVIATGVAYRTLGVPALEALIGVGVFYGAATSEARLVDGRDVFVIGGGNSAGQAAMHLARFARHVTLLVRSESLAASMSEYLIRDLEAAPRIDIRYGSEVADGGGEGVLEWLALRDRASGEVERVDAAALFVLIGAEPRTDWLPDAIARDDWGYVLAGPLAGDPSGHSSLRTDGRLPLLFETSMGGVFTVGDVRRGSIKRVASAAGEGAICVRLIHEYLAEHHSAG